MHNRPLGKEIMRYKVLKIFGVFFVILSWAIFFIYVFACSLTKEEFTKFVEGGDTKPFFLAFLVSFVLGMILYNYGYYRLNKEEERQKRRAEIKKKQQMERFSDGKETDIKDDVATDAEKGERYAHIYNNNG